MSSVWVAPPPKRASGKTAAHCTSPNDFARALTLSSLLFLLTLLAACSAQPQPLVFGEPIWADGETSSYRVTNREGRIVGTATFQVQRGLDWAQEDGWTLHREIIDAGVSERATVEMQPVGYRPLYSRLERTGGSGSQVVEAQIAGGQVELALTNRQGATVYERVQVPSDIRDERTLLLIMRTLPLTQGYATRINSFLPIVGKMERVVLQVRRDESVTVPAGVFDTWVVELKTNERTSRAWVARTAPFAVVKFIDGRSQATFELTGFSAGSR